MPVAKPKPAAAPQVIHHHAPLLNYSGPTKETIGEAKDAIVRILEARADQETIRVALGALSSTVSTTLNVNSCCFTNSPGAAVSEGDPHLQTR